MDSIIYLIVAIVIIGLVFLIFRVVVLWYYKIDERSEQSLKQTELLTLIYLQSGGKIKERDGIYYTAGDTILIINSNNGKEQRINYVDYKKNQLYKNLGSWDVKK